MRPPPFLLLALAALAEFSSALECYTCNNEISGGACEFDPASTGLSDVCSDKFDHCYTRRVEEDGRSSSELIRGCCRIETGSPTCPPGADFQIQTQNSFTYYYTRCSGDLCNDSDGLDNTVQESGGALVVEGVPEDYDYFCQGECAEEDGGAVSITASVATVVLSYLAASVSKRNI